MTDCYAIQIALEMQRWGLVDVLAGIMFLSVEREVVDKRGPSALLLSLEARRHFITRRFSSEVLPLKTTFLFEFKSFTGYERQVTSEVRSSIPSHHLSSTFYQTPSQHLLRNTHHNASGYIRSYDQKLLRA